MMDDLVMKGTSGWDQFPLPPKPEESPDEPPIKIDMDDETARAKSDFLGWLKQQGVDPQKANRHLHLLCRAARLHGRAQEREVYRAYARMIREFEGRDAYIGGKLLGIAREREDQDAWEMVGGRR